MQKLKVIYEDNHIIVVEKIPNVPSQSDKKPLLCPFISLHNNYYKILLLSTRNHIFLANFC